MNAESPTRPDRRPVRPSTALLLSALVLPGLGQMVTGRIARGVIMSIMPLIWLPVVIIKVLRDFFRVMPGLEEKIASGGRITLTDLQQALSPMSGDLVWLLAPLVAVWLWSFVDALVFYRRSRPETPAVPSK